MYKSGQIIPGASNAIQHAYSNNACILAATGNENTSAASYPASNPNVLAVGAVDTGFNRASFSNYGNAYNDFVVAPGVDIYSTYKHNSYEYLSGTSMATPFVTGLAALIVGMARQAGAQFSVDDVYEIVRMTTRPLGSGRGDVFLGQGLIDVQAALAETEQRLGQGGGTGPASSSAARVKPGKRKRARRLKNS